MLHAGSALGGNPGQLSRAFKAGDVMWSPAQTHIGSNAGTTPTHVPIVEPKPDAPRHACTAR